MQDNSLQPITIENKILVIRGQQVMLDRDLAELYGVETKVLNQAVKRNMERFPQTFMFQLNNTEFANWRSQFVTSNSDKMGLRRPPYAFTEQGVAMLSAVLKSDTAVNISIQIMNAFVAMRKFMQNNLLLFDEIVAIKHHQLDADRRIDELFDRMDKYTVDDTQGIFFQGQIFDAYAKFETFIQTATKEIVLIDNYVDLSVLERLAKKTRRKRHHLHAAYQLAHRPRRSDFQRPISNSDRPPHIRYARPFPNHRQFRALSYRRIAQRLRKKVLCV